jgi:hypothetical protein
MSVGWDVVAAVESLLTASVVGLSPVLTVVVQDEFVHDVGFTKVNTLVVTGEDEEEREVSSGGRILLAYPVMVGLILPRGIRREQTQYRKDVRQAVRRALYVTSLAGAATVRDCLSYEPTPPFDRASWGDVFRVTAQRFTYLSDEARTG